MLVSFRLDSCVPEERSKIKSPNPCHSRCLGEIQCRARIIVWGFFLFWFTESSILKWRPCFGRWRMKTTEYVKLQGDLHLIISIFFIKDSDWIPSLAFHACTNYCDQIWVSFLWRGIRGHTSSSNLTYVNVQKRMQKISSPELLIRAWANLLRVLCFPNNSVLYVLVPVTMKSTKKYFSL